VRSYSTCDSISSTLTKLDGGGLQALSTLSILSKLCDAIATSKGTHRQPAPCELFDVIGGIGTGGWIALLLGRYRLDLTRCMSIYLELASDPQICAGWSLFGSNAYTLDQSRLVAKVDSILANYKLNPSLLDDQTEMSLEGVQIRCKHTFAVGAIESPKEGGHKYEIFRTYRTEKTSGPFYHPGPDPATCKISAICAATGATKYILRPYTLGSTTYSDLGFPNPHNITEIAMDEAYHLFGEKPALSAIVNIGPGFPTDHDVEKLQTLSKRFSWPDWLSSSSRSKSPSQIPLSISPASSAKSSICPRSLDFSKRSNTSSSSNSQAERAERQIEADIEQRLKRDYDDREKFMRLAPPALGDDLALNDVLVIRDSSEAVDDFLKQDETKERVKEAARRYCVTPQAS
jgi:hypothetical protein